MKTDSTYRPHPLDARLAELLPPNSLYAVGGRVRDELRADVQRIDLPRKDLDYVVTGIDLDSLREHLRTATRVDLVGASFSVLKVTLDGTTVDVALPRRERSTGAGHREFAIEAGPQVSLEEDLGRRDFRMNMIARALPSGTLVDPFEGEADIRARRIDILRLEAFEEDPLRMLRAAQFAARFDYTLTAQTRGAMSSLAQQIKTVSAERIAEELSKLLVLSQRPSAGLELMRETGLLAELWPELLEGYGVEQNEWHAYDVYHHALATVDAAPPGDLVLRLAALFHDIGKPRTKVGPRFYGHEIVGEELVRAMLSRLRFANQVVDDVAHLVRQHMYSADSEITDAGVRRFIRRIGTDRLEQLFALRFADATGSGLPRREDGNARFEARVWEEIARKPAFSLRDVAVGGTDVIETMVRKGLAQPGFRGDARVGEALHWVFEQVTDRPERNERSCLLALLDEYFDARLAK
ncbi:MAG: HD domain-containing protein [Candidatus Eremiobacteraeota bacterium]|nr:HD domain-containing protein [Candidatus Eremiobacteraeota bacterium]